MYNALALISSPVSDLHLPLRGIKKAISTIHKYRASTKENAIIWLKMVHKSLRHDMAHLSFQSNTHRGRRKKMPEKRLSKYDARVVGSGNKSHDPGYLQTFFATINGKERERREGERKIMEDACSRKEFRGVAAFLSFTYVRTQVRRYALGLIQTIHSFVSNCATNRPLRGRARFKYFMSHRPKGQNC